LVRHEVTDPFLQRLEEPLYLFGQQRPAWLWVALVIAIVAIGLFYVGWMYLRERRTIGWFWPIPLGLFRISVYALLGLLFLPPSRQHYDITRTERSSRVVLLFDTSLSMKEARDGFPEEGGSFKDIPSRQEKVLDFLSDDRVKFIDRLETKGRPVVAWRFANQLDQDYRWIQRDSESKALHFWPSKEAEWARRLVPQKGGQQPTRGYPLSREHWQSWLFPVTEMP